MPDLTLVRRRLSRLPRFDRWDDLRRLHVMGAVLVLSCVVQGPSPAEAVVAMDNPMRLDTDGKDGVDLG
mgnify:CR=1 FL=1